MMASSKNQGRHFSEMMLNIEVDHYVFHILYLGTQSIPVAQIFSKELPIN